MIFLQHRNREKEATRPHSETGVDPRDCENRAQRSVGRLWLFWLNHGLVSLEPLMLQREA
jgi:hypothetical protein